MRKCNVDLDIHYTYGKGSAIAAMKMVARHVWGKIMAFRKIIGIVLLLNGIIIFIVASSADFIGLGEYPGYGYKQISGNIVGAIAIIAGATLFRKK